MKKLIPRLILITALSCQSDDTVAPIPDYEICAADSAKYLSYAPTSKVVVNAAGKNTEIDFNCNEYIAERIFEYDDRLHDTVHTLGQLANAYKVQLPRFWTVGPPISPYFDGDYVFPKLEYLLTQECIQDNCCSDTRKAILRMAVDKQKLKYEDWAMTITTRQTGVFLMAVILVKENDSAFINALSRDIDLQNALSLSITRLVDKEFGNKMMQFAENFLKRK
jgi:hypothetical protein